MDSPEFKSQQGRKIFPFSRTSRTSLELHQPPIQFVPGLHSVSKSGRNVKSTTALPFLQKLRMRVTLHLSPIGVHALQGAMTTTHRIFQTL